MVMRKVKIGGVEVTGLCIGANPFCGISHQSDARSKEMLAYYTPACIKDTLRKVEAAGSNTVFARTDEHIYGIMRDYWKEGGKIQWFAQVNTPKENFDLWRDWLKRAVELGASGMYMHGGALEFWFANGKLDMFHEALGLMRSLGVKAAGMAGHNHNAHAWMRDNLDVDFQMCCYYNPTDRSQNPHHQSLGEKWNDADRENMLRVIPTIKTPVVHYKVFAGGNKPIIESFERLGKTVRPSDIVCVGMFLKDDPDMITKNVALFEKHVDKVKVVRKAGSKKKLGAQIGG